MDRRTLSFLAVIFLLTAGFIGFLRLTNERPRERIVVTPDSYPSNPAPLKTGRFVRLPFGSIHPQGWLREQMVLQAKGLTGYLDRIFPDVGPDSAWLGGGGEAWERGPYYWRGVVALAYVLDDTPMKEKARPWIEWALSSQREDGNFGTWRQDWWPKMIVCQALGWYYEATRDARVILFMERFYRYQLLTIEREPLKEWAVYRGGDNIEPILWLYKRNRDPALLKLASLLRAQTYDWAGLFLGGHPFQGGSFIEHRHAVNVAHGLKTPMVSFLLKGGDRDAKASLAGLELLDRFYGQAHGVWAGDEPVAPTSGFHGTELCTTVEALHSLGMLIEALGEPSLGDRFEKAAFNALPAALLPDGKGYQYYIQPNTVNATKGLRGFQTDHGSNLSPGGISGYPCCAVNMHYAWPWVAQTLYMAVPGGGLAAIAYAPCRVEARVAQGTAVTITQETDYPFRDRVEVRVDPEREAEFELWLRIPGWCRTPAILVNGEAQTPPKPGSFAVVRRIWKMGDSVTMRFPMEPLITRWENRSVAVERGPLVFALKVGESWTKADPHEELKGPMARLFPSWEIRPTTIWNYALIVDETDPQGFFQVQEAGIVARQPFTQRSAPVCILARARRIGAWGLDGFGNAQPPPPGPLTLDTPAESVTLVPLACTKLRVTYLPIANP
jgi:uncharacterized protein